MAPDANMKQEEESSFKYVQEHNRPFEKKKKFVAERSF